MPKNKNLVGIQPLKKVAKKKGIRLSEEAAEYLSKTIEEYILKIIKESSKITEVRNKNTIQEKDIQLSIELITKKQE